MTNRLLTLALMALLAGCSSTNPFTNNSTDTETDTGTDPDTETEFAENGINATVAGDLSKITYSPGNATITVEGITLDDVPITAQYRRNAALDVPGYQAYTIQEDPLDRHSTAFVRQTGNSGQVRGGVVSTGGQFNRYYGGVYYERDGGFTPPTVSPTSGIVSYAGNYAGLTNMAGDGGDLLPVPVGTASELIPADAAEISGLIFLNAEFADNAVNGAIYNRVLVDAGNLALPPLALIGTKIESDGTFNGTVEYLNQDIGQGKGTYSGIFGGPNAEGVAGGVRMNEFDGSGNALGIEDEEEYGVFVLDQCGTAAANAPVCATVNPDAGTP